jgi:hypothetical protein
VDVALDCRVVLLHYTKVDFEEDLNHLGSCIIEGRNFVDVLFHIGHREVVNIEVPRLNGLAMIW